MRVISLGFASRPAFLIITNYNYPLQLVHMNSPTSSFECLQYVKRIMVQQLRGSVPFLFPVSVFYFQFISIVCFSICPYKYRSVPLIRPPILYTTSSLKWGEGLYSSMQVVSNISPPPPPPPPPPPKKKRSFTRSLHNGMPFQITMATSFRIESTVRGHHVYKASWSPYIGEELPVQCEVNNIHDDFAVAVLKNSNTVGYVPREISSLLVLPA